LFSRMKLYPEKSRAIITIKYPVIDN